MTPQWRASVQSPRVAGHGYPTYSHGVSTPLADGVGLRLTQFGTWLLSWLVRGGLLRSGVPLAGLLHRGAVLVGDNSYYDTLLQYAQNGIALPAEHADRAFDRARLRVTAQAATAREAAKAGAVA